MTAEQVPVRQGDRDVQDEGQKKLFPAWTEVLGDEPARIPQGQEQIKLEKIPNPEPEVIVKPSRGRLKRSRRTNGFDGGVVGLPITPSFCADHAGIRHARSD